MSGYRFYMYTNIYGDFQICISGPLKGSIASDWIFLWWILNNLFNSSNSSNDRTLFLHTIFKSLSRIWFVFELAFLLWIAHVNGQYPNCDSTNALSNAFFCFQNSNNLKILVKHSFLSAFFLHKSKRYSSRFGILSITKPDQVVFVFFALPGLCLFRLFLPKQLHIYIHKKVNDTYPDLISKNYTQTTQ